MNPMKGEPAIRFDSTGAISLNKYAIKHLKLRIAKSLFPVSICRDTKCHSEFSITKDLDGWVLREDHWGRAVFNCAELSRYVIDETWNRTGSHGVGVEKPRSIVFRIARMPVDDDKNKDVFALLRKRE
jgi:hypothetical protein